ncbi:MAG TPA: type I secretion C-terminal target domain-containing protein, partial [Allosphingosinicella sp.]
MIRKTGSPVGETIVASLLRTRIDAGGGNDTLIGVSEDQLFGGDGNDVITAGAGDSFLSGDSGDDRLTDGAGNDALYGGDGNDILVSRAGSDWLQGDAGNDSFTIIRSASGQAGDGILGSGGSGNDDFYIDTSGSYYSYVAVYCGDGDDVVEIGGVSGWLDLTLGAGSDTIRFDSVPHGELFASVTVSDFQVGDGGDRLDFNRLLGFLVGNVTASPFTLGYLQLVQNGADTLVTSKFGDLATLKNVDAASLTAWNLGGYGQDGSLQGPTTVGGTPGDDLLFGGSGADTIDGGPGNDTIWGGMGNDTLTGGDGNDQLSADFGDNHLDGGAGDDILADGTGSDVLIGGDGNDTIIAEGSDTIDGGDGDDRLTSLVGDGDTAHAVTGAGADRITLFSEGGVATLDTGSDNDTVSIAELDGSLQLTLGSGSDLVTFNTSLTSGSVVITDFQTGDAGDVLDVVPLLTIGTNWNRTSNPFAAGNVRLLQAGADTLLQIDGAAGDGHWVTLATLQNTVATSFTAANLRGLPTDGSSAPGIVISGSGGITGTIGPDSITGSEGADNIKGAAGDDMIFGNGGNDRIDGGPGVDTVHGGGGDDTITVGSGADTVHGDDGADHLTGNVVGAHLFGDDGNDRIDDNAGAAEVDGGAGDDVIQIWVPGSPTVTVRGGSGDDAMLSVGGGTPNLIVDMGDGRDSVALFSFSAATITLGAGADALSLIYSLIGATAPSLVVTDFAAGAAGDWLDLSGLLSFNAGGWNQGMNPFDSFYLRVVQSGPDTLVQFDRDAAGSSADYVTVAVLQNVVATALTKENFGYGSDSADFFDLRAGAPGVWHGLGGDDVFYLGDAGAQFPGGRYDTVFADGGAGADTVVLQGDYSTGLLLANGALGDIETLRVLSHLDATYGGAGADPFSYVLQTDDDEVAEGAHLLVDASGLQADEPLTFDGSSETDGFLHVVGGAGADDITGGGAADLLEGGDGNDTLDGSYGDDVMAGGAGDDTYFVDDAGDLAVEQSGEGTDTVFTSLAAYTLPDNIENLTAELYADETLTGNALDNIITGFLGNDTIDGGTGADTMAGGVGDDVYFVDNAGDVVTEIAGEGTDEIRTTLATYTLPANVEKLTYAGSGNFTGIGSTGDDIITSNGGNDFFDLTQGGADKASGGGGTDAFSFGAAFGAGDSVDGGAGADTVGIRGDY